MQGVIDYETTSVYQLVVVARDRGRDPLSGECIVVIRVQDINDNAPKITIRTLTSDVIGHLSHSPLAQVYTPAVSCSSSSNVILLMIVRVEIVCLLPTMQVVGGSGGVEFSTVFCLFSARYLEYGASRITRLDTEIFHHESCKPIYFGVKRSKVKVTRHTKQCRCPIIVTFPGNSPAGDFIAGRNLRKAILSWD